MDDAALQKRLDAIILLLVVILLLLIALGVQYSPEVTVGVVIPALLIGYGHRKRN